jgi:hypothetical protein
MNKKDTTQKKPNEEERIIEGFVDKLVNNQKDIPEDILEIVNKNFWDLIY